LVLAQQWKCNNHRSIYDVSIPHWFSLNMAAIYYQYPSFLVSIPHWFSLNTGRFSVEHPNGTFPSHIGSRST